ncbi:ABC transporter ATP-binding protein [Hazenella coriacea]|uniref:ABC-type nitrate/sulfonate/bicarbonate transport system ATPase subunit n=1 Tax=Hazenella coriacea TaxID=1179467 RepID=A0A4R3LC55_9BACL|nr:ABC transporter ATP-binding protein [Hazenella coriacea]TCS95904.1 ABC-type nitrate/sulfonate/bicarbonate transport system ATPase subunit [Hazenella coriacea]
MPLLEIKDLSFSYDNKQIIDQLSLQVNQGEFVSLIGPSGSGKSTLFYCIGGLHVPQDGEIWLHGKRVQGQRGQIGYMPQQPSLLPWRTITENVRLAQELKNKLNDAEISDLLDRAGLSDVAHHYPHELSGGMQQRVAFTRALASRSQLLCLDEPFAALDALTRANMQQWLFSLFIKEQLTILFITHSIDEAILLSDRIYVLDANPMSIKEEQIVPFPREERITMRGSKEWLQLARKLEDLLITKESEHAHL